MTIDTPELLVENQLAEGSYRFQLVAIDDSGNESGPAELVVTVRAPTRPTTINPNVFTTVRPTVLATPVSRTIQLGKIIDPIRRP